jgi:hypothetical protein
MDLYLGTTPGVFLAVSVTVLGGAAYMTGQALAGAWRPVWQVVLYCLLLALAARFLIYALFQGTLLSPTGYLTDAAVLLLIGLVSYRLRHVSRMVQQYPWLYERTGPLGYRARSAGIK